MYLHLNCLRISWTTLPTISVMFGFAEHSRIIVVGMSAFFPLVLNSMTGAQQINENYWAVAKIHRVSLWSKIRDIILPSSVPYIISGIRISFNNAFVVTIALELVAANNGIGRVLWQDWQTLRTEELFAGLLIIGILSIANINSPESWLLRWK